MNAPQTSPIERLHHPTDQPAATPIAATITAVLPLVGDHSGTNAATKDSVPVVRGSRISRGPGGAGLERLAATLSRRDLAVLDIVREHRFAATGQIQQFCFAGHRTPAAGARACRRVLQRLAIDHLLTTTRRRIGGFGAGSTAAVWMLTSTGLRLSNLQRGVGAIGRIREPGERFIEHYLAIADARLQLLTAERAGLLELSTIEIEPQAWRTYLGTSGERLTLKPDLHAVTVPADGGKLGEFEDHWFIEVDRGTESIPTLLGQCQQYEAYRRTGSEQTAGGVFPLVLWVVPDTRRAERLSRAITAAARINTADYRICTPDELIATVLGGQGAPS